MSELGTLIRSVLAIDPAAPAMEFEGRWCTWGQLEGLITKLDEALLEIDLGAGARVAVVLRNVPEIAAVLTGVVITDRCMVTLNPLLPDERLAKEVAAVGAPVLIACAEDWRRPGFLKAARKTGSFGFELIRHGGLAEIRAIEGLGEGAQQGCRLAEGISVEMLTSGTTGVPKRIPLKTKTLERAVLGASIYDRRAGPLSLRRGVQIINAPFAHIAGVFALFNCLVAARQACLLERFSVERFVDAITRHKPKVASAPPSALRMILDAKVDPAALGSLVAIRTGTAPLDPDLADEFLATYKVPVLQNYGATEFAGGVAGWTLDDFKTYATTKRGSVGRIEPGVSARNRHSW